MIGQSVPNPIPGDPPRSMTLMDHLLELRMRLVKVLIGLLIGMSGGMFLVFGPFRLVDYIIEAFTPLPLGNPNYPRVQVFATAEQFTSYTSVALAIGFVFVMPILVYQTIAFLLPGLERKEQRYLFLAMPFVMFFFLLGLVFGWFITVPAAIRFLISFSDSPLIANQPSLADFLQTVTTLLLTNGLIFELPIIIYILARMDFVTAKQLSNYRKYAFLLVTIIAAIITPTGDPINLLLLALPMYLLFEFGILLARLVPTNKI